MAMHGAKMPNQGLDACNWPVALCSFASLPWLHSLWEHLPTATAIYTFITALFMVFQMADKLGLLDRFKRKPKDRQ